VHGRARHSQSQGGVERLNRRVEEKLAKWCLDADSPHWSTVGRCAVRWQVSCEVGPVAWTCSVNRCCEQWVWIGTVKMWCENMVWIGSVNDWCEWVMWMYGVNECCPVTFTTFTSTLTSDKHREDRGDGAVAVRDSLRTGAVLCALCRMRKNSAVFCRICLYSSEFTISAEFRAFSAEFACILQNWSVLQNFGFFCRICLYSTEYTISAEF
jgi:hypothetical protein